MFWSKHTMSSLQALMTRFMLDYALKLGAVDFPWWRGALTTWKRTQLMNTKVSTLEIVKGSWFKAMSKLPFSSPKGEMGGWVGTWKLSWPMMKKSSVLSPRNLNSELWKSNVPKIRNKETKCTCPLSSLLELHKGLILELHIGRLVLQRKQLLSWFLLKELCQFQNGNPPRNFSKI